MNKLIQKIGVLILVLLVSAIAVYTYVYKGHKNITLETPAFISTPSSMIQEFSLDIEASSEKYLDKIIQLKGVVTLVEKSIIVIDQNITCYFDDAVDRNLLLNHSITIKGRFLGYDELLEEIKIDQCIIITD